ncbi:beta-1,6-N-acetylglucosaminyltransferase [Vibrio breoganii]
MHIVAIICHRLTSSLLYTVGKLKDDHTILIHVDAKANLSDFSELSGPNVHILEERIDVKWGHRSQIDVTLMLMKHAVEMNFDYFSLISGDDIPVVDSRAVYRLLDKKEYISVTPANTDFKKRLKFIYSDVFYKRDILSKLQKNIMSKFLKESKLYESLPKLYCGSNWFSITRGAVCAILKYLVSNPKYYDSFKYSLCGDEIFFHTILMDLRYIDRLNVEHANTKSHCSAALRFIDFESGPEYPKILRLNDLIDLKKSRDIIFCRKVDEKISVSDLVKLFG